MSTTVGPSLAEMAGGDDPNLRVGLWGHATSIGTFICVRRVVFVFFLLGNMAAIAMRGVSEYLIVRASVAASRIDPPSKC